MAKESSKEKSGKAGSSSAGKKSTTESAATQTKAPLKRRGKKKTARQVSVGAVHIKATYNNTVITFTDANGNVLAWSTAGACGFKGPKKSTPYAASVIVKTAAEKVRPYGLTDITVYVRGVGSGREGALRALNIEGFNVLAFKDVTPVPHNGCRARKVRRV